MEQWPRSNDVLGTANRANPAESGLVTAGSANTTHVGVSYNSLRIQGYVYGSRGLAAGLSKTADDCVFPNVTVNTSFGADRTTKANLPIMSGALGSNVEGVIKGEERAIIVDGVLIHHDKVHGNWDKLPATVREIGHSPDEIFAGYYDVQKKVGKEEMKNIPFGAIAIWTLGDKLAAGLQQLMAGARKFSLDQLDRSDLTSANRETEKETGIPFITDVQDEAARKILKG